MSLPRSEETAGVPGVYWVQRGNTAEALTQLALHPRSSVARTNGIKLWSVMTPTVLTSTADSLPVNTVEERFLLPGVCYGLAQAEQALGRDNAPLAYWRGEWQGVALPDWRSSVEKSGRGDLRRIIRRDPMSRYDYF